MDLLHIQTSASQMLDTSHRLGLETKSGPWRVEISSPELPWAEGLLSQWQGAAQGGPRGLVLGLRAALAQAVPFSSAVI